MRLRRIFCLCCREDFIQNGDIRSNPLSPAGASIAREAAGGMQHNRSRFGVESRSDVRTNLFLAAILHSAGTAHRVTIRDLSAAGARIETSLVPQVGDAVTLVRARLTIDARVTWRAKRFCGLSFTAPVSIPAWMANPVLLERERMRPRVALDREVASPVHCEAGKAGGVAEELARVSHRLGAIGHTLAGDPVVLFKHGTQLFRLRQAARSLAALADTLQADAPQAPARSGEPDELGA